MTRTVASVNLGNNFAFLTPKPEEGEAPSSSAARYVRSFFLSFLLIVLIVGVVVVPSVVHLLFAFLFSLLHSHLLPPPLRL